MTASATTPPKVLPPHYFLAAIFAILGVGWVAPGGHYPTWVSFFGVIPIVAGFWLAIKASRQFKAADTNIIPLSRSTALVTDGAFALSRNPMYAGMILTLAGISWLTTSAWSWIVPCAFFVLIRQQFVVREEMLMEETFQDSYRAYKKNVRRWI